MSLIVSRCNDGSINIVQPSVSGLASLLRPAVFSAGVDGYSAMRAERRPRRRGRESNHFLTIYLFCGWTLARVGEFRSAYVQRFPSSRSTSAVRPQYYKHNNITGTAALTHCCRPCTRFARGATGAGGR